MKAGKIILFALLMLAAITVAVLLLLMRSPQAVPLAETDASLPVPTQTESTLTAPMQTDETP